MAQLKVAWWREELARLEAGTPLHPITRYLAALPRAAAADFAPLTGSIEAVARQIAGAPLAHAAQLPFHADALHGIPLRVAARLGGAGGAGAEDTGLDACVRALAAGEYLLRAIGGYPRAARGGRVLFPVDELLAAGIEDADLAADAPPPRLQAYLGRLRRRAAVFFEEAANALAPAERPPLRHLLVLASLGARHAAASPRRPADFRPGDLYNAWTAARRAARAR